MCVCVFFYSVDELFVGKKEQGTRRSRKTEQFSFLVAWERNDQKSKASSKLIGRNRFSIVPVLHSFIILCSKWEDMEVTNEVLYYTEHVHAQVRDCSTTSKVDGAYTSTRSNTHRVRDNDQFRWMKIRAKKMDTTGNYWNGGKDLEQPQGNAPYYARVLTKRVESCPDL